MGPTVCASASLNTMIKTIRERPCTLAGGSWHLGTFVKRFAGTFVKRFVRSLAVFHHGTGKKTSCLTYCSPIGRNRGKQFVICMS